MLAHEAMTQRECRLVQEMNQVQAFLQLISGRCAQGCDGGSDILDQANHTVELATNRALRRLHQEKLRQLESAWARIRTGQYGICESCGVQIDPARLDLMPHATLCARCQRANGNSICQANHRVDCSGIREVTR
jgi:RNA polymerase-binding transcription factor DksA